MKQVKTNYGVLEGVELEGCSRFLGVPYAKPPIGPLRWQEPQKPESWEGVREAKAFSNRAWQLCTLYHEGDPAGPGINYGREFYANPDFMPEMSEDCLYLNVWTPAKSADEKLPVAFWIHGGAFLNGWGGELEFDGESFAKKGVILVTINYRLGPFGFLCHRELRDENGRSGNYGILDQLAALDWVRENIGAFGGDPDRITIFGQSAGAMSVQTIVCSPLARGKFAGAILQSGAGYRAGFSRDLKQEDAFVMGEAFSAATGASAAQEMRALPAAEIMGKFGDIAQECGKRGLGGLPFVPVIDGHLLVKGYADYLSEGLHPDVPYMIGSCGNDMGATPESKAAGKHIGLYYGCINWSLHNQELGRKPAYVYYFDRELLGSDDGAFHSAELWYVFGTLGRSWRPKTDGDYELGERISSYWANFVKTGNPNGEGLPQWDPCGWEDHNVLTLDVNE